MLHVFSQEEIQNLVYVIKNICDISKLNNEGLRDDKQGIIAKKLDAFVVCKRENGEGDWKYPEYFVYNKEGCLFHAVNLHSNIEHNSGYFILLKHSRGWIHEFKRTVIGEYK